MTDELLTKVEQINVLLRAFGQVAVQEIKMVKDGKTVGQVRYGYRPQYIFDAVNYVIRPENWRYEIVSKEIFEYQAVVEVKLFLRINSGEWLCKGSQTGQMTIVKKNVGDAYKGAVTDALQKCFSLLSIGCDAYRGLLKGVYQGRQSATAFNTYPKEFANNKPLQGNTPPQVPPVENSQKSKSQPPKVSKSPEQLKPSTPLESPVDLPLPKDLPPITGVDWVWNDDGDRIIAVGDTYNKKHLIRSSGFKFNGTEKHWYKEYPPMVQ